MSATAERVLCTILGTRPELVKLAPLVPLLDAEPGLKQILLHTGQHYSYEMDAVFFADLELRAPDVLLHVGSGSHAEMTARILTGVERALIEHHADGVLVLGDTNSTLGGALAAAKLGREVIHVEAGCRSFLRTMPEEINRKLVDHCSTLLCAPNQAAATQLRGEGIPEELITVVGSTAIDAARTYVERARSRPLVEQLVAELGVNGPQELLLCTVHRAENTTPEVLPGLLAGLGQLAERYPIVWPVHPRTQKVMGELGLAVPPRVRALPPIGYLDMLALLSSVRALLTDSGGLQEEAYAVGTPLLVLRNETEWTYLLGAGCAALIGNREALAHVALPLLTDEAVAHMRTAGRAFAAHANDGDAAKRIAAAVRRRLIERG
ncbi:MAG: UDP-N-acetylglucosamine 2-epimerase (non-hydrolyzing) [Polyangia bacterium]